MFDEVLLIFSPANSILQLDLNTNLPASVSANTTSIKPTLKHFLEHA